MPSSARPCPKPGGIYVYLREAYGPLISFLFGWTLFLVIDSGSIATLAVAFSANMLPRFVALTPLETKIIAAVFVALSGRRQLRGRPLGGPAPDSSDHH